MLWIKFGSAFDVPPLVNWRLALVHSLARGCYSWGGKANEYILSMVVFADTSLEFHGYLWPAMPGARVPTVQAISCTGTAILEGQDKWDGNGIRVQCRSHGCPPKFLSRTEGKPRFPVSVKEIMSRRCRLVCSIHWRDYQRIEDAHFSGKAAGGHHQRPQGTSKIWIQITIIWWNQNDRIQVLQHFQGQAAERTEQLNLNLRKEAVVMRIITRVTLLYLPATFVLVGGYSFEWAKTIDENPRQTLFSTDIVKYQNQNGAEPGHGIFSPVAMRRWLQVTVPLTFITLGVAWLAYKTAEAQQQREIQPKLGTYGFKSKETICSSFWTSWRNTPILPFHNVRQELELT